jgi:copper chaperone CopZ
MWRIVSASSTGRRSASVERRSTSTNSPDVSVVTPALVIDSATVERNLKKLDGVNTAVVNLSSERATVAFDSAKLGLGDMIARVQRAGYGVATGEADLIIKRISDDNDARRLEKTLLKLEGVLEAHLQRHLRQASAQALRVNDVPEARIAEPCKDPHRRKERDQLFERIALELQRSLDHFDRQFSNTPLARLLLAPLPEEVGLSTYLAGNLSAPVESVNLGDVLDFHDVPELREPTEQMMRWQTLGTALRVESA